MAPQSGQIEEIQALFDREAKANQVYPPLNWSDLFPGFKRFQESIRYQTKRSHG